MQMSLKTKLVASVAGVAAVVGGGAAIASTQLGDPETESRAIVNDVAGQLGVSPERLTSALKTALENRVDAAVAAGRLTDAQGEALKTRIQSGGAPLLGGLRGGFGHHHGAGGLDAAATYLGLTEAELRAQLEAGKSLAQVAQDRQKSVDGLVQALVAEAKEKLDAAVEAGRLTEAQRQSMASGLEQRITGLVNRAPGSGRFFRGGRHFEGPPPFAVPDA